MTESVGKAKGCHSALFPFPPCWSQLLEDVGVSLLGFFPGEVCALQCGADVAVKVAGGVAVTIIGIPA